MVFLSINNGSYGQIYALQSYTYDKTNANNNAPQSQINMLDNSLKVFPNPANNMITFDLSQLQSTEFTLKIYDELGREKEVPVSNAYMDMGVEKLDVDISKFIPGVYFYKLNADQEYSGRFVKQ